MKFGDSINNRSSERTQIFVTRGCVGAIFVIRNLVTHKATPCLDDWLVVTELVPLLLQHWKQFIQLCWDLGICRQMGEVGPRAIQGSVSRNVNKHHPREGLSGGLSDSLSPRFCRLVPSPPVFFCKDVAAALGPHGIPGALCSQGSCSNAPTSVATESLLVSSCRRSLITSASDSGLQGCLRWWLEGER